MIQQKTKDVSAIVFIENRIMPTKFYIGMHVQDEQGTILLKSHTWHNSKDVYLFAKLDSRTNKTLIVIPSTRVQGEELEFTLSVHSNCKISLKKIKEGK